MPIFTHKKRPHWGANKTQLRFKIHVNNIKFASNEYFLPKSQYSLYRQGNANKYVRTSGALSKVQDTKCMVVDDSFEFKSKLFQDSSHQAMGRFMPKEKKLMLRQTAKVRAEGEVFADVGFLRLPLHVYAGRDSGFTETLEIYDPERLAKGTVDIRIEHRPVKPGQKMPTASSANKSRTTKKDSKDDAATAAAAGQENKTLLVTTDASGTPTAISPPTSPTNDDKECEEKTEEDRPATTTAEYDQINKRDETVADSKRSQHQHKHRRHGSTDRMSHGRSSGAAAEDGGKNGSVTTHTASRSSSGSGRNSAAEHVNSAAAAAPPPPPPPSYDSLVDDNNSSSSSRHSYRNKQPGTLQHDSSSIEDTVGTYDAHNNNHSSNNNNNENGRGRHLSRTASGSGRLLTVNSRHSNKANNISGGNGSTTAGKPPLTPGSARKQHARSLLEAEFPDEYSDDGNNGSSNSNNDTTTGSPDPSEKMISNSVPFGGASRQHMRGSVSSDYDSDVRVVTTVGETGSFRFDEDALSLPKTPDSNIAPESSFAATSGTSTNISVESAPATADTATSATVGDNTAAAYPSCNDAVATSVGTEQDYAAASSAPATAAVPAAATAAAAVNSGKEHDSSAHTGSRTNVTPPKKTIDRSQSKYIIIERPEGIRPTKPPSPPKRYVTLSNVGAIPQAPIDADVHGKIQQQRLERQQRKQQQQLDDNESVKSESTYGTLLSRDTTRTGTSTLARRMVPVRAGSTAAGMGMDVKNSAVRREISRGMSGSGSVTGSRRQQPVRQSSNSSNISTHSTRSQQQHSHKFARQHSNTSNVSSSQSAHGHHMQPVRQHSNSSTHSSHSAHGHHMQPVRQHSNTSNISTHSSHSGRQHSGSNTAGGGYRAPDVQRQTSNSSQLSTGSSGDYSPDHPTPTSQNSKYPHVPLLASALSHTATSSATSSNHGDKKTGVAAIPPPRPTLTEKSLADRYAANKRDEDAVFESAPNPLSRTPSLIGDSPRESLDAYDRSPRNSPRGNINGSFSRSASGTNYGDISPRGESMSYNYGSVAEQHSRAVSGAGPGASSGHGNRSGHASHHYAPVRHGSTGYSRENSAASGPLNNGSSPAYRYIPPQSQPQPQHSSSSGRHHSSHHDASSSSSHHQPHRHHSNSSHSHSQHHLPSSSSHHNVVPAEKLYEEVKQSLGRRAASGTGGMQHQRSSNGALPVGSTTTAPAASHSQSFHSSGGSQHHSHHQPQPQPQRMHHHNSGYR